MKGIDYAWSKPTASWIKAQGYEFVMRYLSRDSSKDLSRAEASSLASYGIWMGVVWETRADRARDGYAAGWEDAVRALAAARELDMPEDRPIYFAVDFDATNFNQIKPYFQGVNRYMGVERTGVYGGYDVCRWMALNKMANWFWQTLAWSGGRWFEGNHIEQYKIGPSWDENRAKQLDFGQWMPGKSPEEIDNMSDKDVAKAVWRTDNVLDSPPTRQGNGNKFWAAQSFFLEIYAQNEKILANQAALATDLAAVKAAVEGLTAPAAAEAGAVVDELAARLKPADPPATA